MPETNQDQAEYRGICGEQGDLIIATIPAGAATSLIGQKLKGSVLTVAGTYTCLIPMNGFSSVVEVNITVTLVTQTITDDIYSTYNDEVTKKTSFTGVGAIVSATRQTSTYAPKGERRAIVSLPVVGAGSCTFTQAEYNGI